MAKRKRSQKRPQPKQIVPLFSNRYLGNSLHRGDGPCKVPVGGLLGRGGGSAGGAFAAATGLGFAGFFFTLGQPVFGMDLHLSGQLGLSSLIRLT